MNDRYMFRGKRLDNGKWTQGQLLVTINNSYRIVNASKNNDFDGYEIDPATLGQCTGLKDKNGKLIFEGDIVNRLKPDMLAGGHVVIWANQKWMLSRISKLNPAIHSDINVRNKFLEIIGNIHDNPSLLESTTA